MDPRNIFLGGSYQQTINRSSRKVGPRTSEFILDQRQMSSKWTAEHPTTRYPYYLFIFESEKVHRFDSQKPLVLTPTVQLKQPRYRATAGDTSMEP